MTLAGNQRKIAMLPFRTIIFAVGIILSGTLATLSDRYPAAKIFHGTPRVKELLAELEGLVQKHHPEIPKDWCTNVLFIPTPVSNEKFEPVPPGFTRLIRRFPIPTGSISVTVGDFEAPKDPLSYKSWYICVEITRDRYTGEVQNLFGTIIGRESGMSYSFLQDFRAPAAAFNSYHALPKPQ